MKFLTLSTAFIISFAILGLAELPGLGSNLERRQLGNCEATCSWFGNLASCAQTDIACNCRVLDQAGLYVSTCASCLEFVNETLAAEVIEAEQICQAQSSSSATVTSTQAPTQPCFSQCSLISEALASCTNEACFCPTLIAGGSACSQCYATVNDTEASALASIITECISDFPTHTTTTMSQTSHLSMSTTSVSSSSPPSTASGGLSSGAIGGIAAGIVGGFVLLGAIAFFGLRQRGHFTNETVAPAPRLPVFLGDPSEMEPKPELLELNEPTARIRYFEPQDQEELGQDGGRLSRRY